MSTTKSNRYKEIALALSLAVLVLLSILGTGTTIAWFSDTSPKIKNVFHFADFKLTVSHRLPDGTWEEIDANTKIFDDEALYEPNYVQVVYLKVENTGTRAFRFKTAVRVTDFVTAVNVFGQNFNLQDYLRFGVVDANTEAALEEKIANREKAIALADKRVADYVPSTELPLNRYSTETADLDAGATAYLALIVRMPKEIGNVANYRGSVVPKVELGITVDAEQIKD